MLLGKKDAKMLRIDFRSAVPFCGVKKPYKKQGATIIPIAQDPTNEDIKQAKNAAKNTKDAMQGYNGYAFFLGEDLVVKKFKGKEAFSNDPDREINILDTMYDNNLVLKNSQEGLWALKDDDGTYLVSTKVEGENPDPDVLKFNKNNLESLVEIITNMDKGANIAGASKPEYSPRARFMNYDFNGENIKITDSQAGLFDFEYSVLENIDAMIEKTIVKKQTGTNCHQSDTSALPSSLRSFEFYTFCDYLCDLPDDETDELFNDYIEIKGKYHQNMHEFYRDFANDSKFKDIVSNISEHELIHSHLLKKGGNGRIPDDILIAEARKIQMSHFMHEQSQYSDTGKINPKQLKQYTDESIEFFASNLEKAIENEDEDRIIYYKDCLELFSSWEKVNLTLKEKIANDDPEIIKKLSKTYALTLDSKLGAAENA